MIVSDAAALLRRRRGELLNSLAQRAGLLEEIWPEDETERAYERLEEELVARLSHTDQAEIMRIDAALKRIEEGTYGICHRCGENIAALRLLAVPTAALCLNCMSE